MGVYEAAINGKRVGDYLSFAEVQDKEQDSIKSEETF